MKDKVNVDIRYNVYLLLTSMFVIKILNWFPLGQTCSQVIPGAGKESFACGTSKGQCTCS